MELPVENVNIFNSVINDIQSLQSKYDNTISTLNKKIKILTKDHQQISQENDDLQNQLQTSIEILNVADSKLLKLIDKNNMLSNENQMLSLELQNANSTIRQLQETISSMEQDKREFSKVSHVVALEKENSKLRSDIESMKRTNGMQNKPTIEQHMVVDKEVTSQPVEEAEIDVFEKKIKGSIYYISCQDNSTIYAKNDDGTIGSILGRLEKDKISQKTKVKWNT